MRISWLRLLFSLSIILLLTSGHTFSMAKKSPSQAEIHSGPGSLAFSSTLIDKLRKASALRGNKYLPRTKHLHKNGKAKFTNRLFLESSPYLLQHAHNPVNWFAWGDEPFELAQKLKRPVLLSVGYSTCHWCHVMEEESFEDLEIAKFLNENYIVIKVDREERPDVDNIYMGAIHAMGQNGGWPMNVWLTENRKPFYGGTYFPARDGDRGRSKGFLTVIKTLKDAYTKQKKGITKASNEIAQALSENLAPNGLAPNGKSDFFPPKSVLIKTAKKYIKGYDKLNGGMGSGNKFPSSVPARFLLRYYKKTKDQEALKLIELTLKKMAAGGMYDHVGGGFHRYSTDPKWLVPHFEKMLYDNALLVPAYLEAYQVTRNTEYLRIVNEILHYISRDMTSKDGAFYSATDADSLNHLGHIEEGYYFTWTPKELSLVLNKEQLLTVNKYYGVSKTGNFEGRNIFNTPLSRKKVAKSLKISIAKLNKIIKNSRSILYAHRKLRPRPIRDEKVLTAWNGLMISSYAMAGRVLNNQKYIEKAVLASEFLIKNLYKNNKLKRSYKDGIAKNRAFLSDYAFFIAGLLDLFEATSSPKWLQLAIELDLTLKKEFEDVHNSGLYMTSILAPKLLVREKPNYDGAEPSGNSVHALNLLRLGELTTRAEYYKRAESLFTYFATTLKSSPASLTQMLIALDFYYDKPKEIIIVSSDKASLTNNVFNKVLSDTFIPNKVLINIVAKNKNYNQLLAIMPAIDSKFSIDGKPTAYVCEKGICKRPTTNGKEFLQLILPTKKNHLNNNL